MIDAHGMAWTEKRAHGAQKGKRGSKSPNFPREINKILMQFFS